jgi:transcription elongation factor Elf1
MWLQQKYIGLVSSRLDRFRRVNAVSYNFRCPICGDSTKSRTKARGYLALTRNKDTYLFHCHNGCPSTGFDNFLKQVDPVLYNDYSNEKLESKFMQRELTPVEEFANKMKTPKFISESPLKKLKKVSQLKYDHPAKLYIQSRKIPNEWHSRLFYVSKFKAFTNTVLPNKFENVDNDHPRLIIPFLDKDGNFFGYTGRAFHKTAAKYITIIVDDSQPKIFNMDQCDTSKTHYIVEGPIDCMFLDNAMAMSGAHIDKQYLNENSVLVFDNEPRSPDTCKRMNKYIECGYKIVIWPSDLKEKDINEMVLNGIDFKRIIDNNIKSGLYATATFNQWKKV